MTETITTQSQSENDSWGNQYPEDLQKKVLEHRDAIWNNEVKPEEVFTQEEMRTIEEIDLPDRIEDPEEARAMAEATYGQEAGMARSRARIDTANEQIDTLEREANSKKTALGRIAARIATSFKVRDIEMDIADVDNPEYWEEITAQRDRYAAQAQAEYRAENNPQ